MFKMLSCPECKCDFMKLPLILLASGINEGFDEWNCPSCFTMLDVWWAVEDLVWHHSFDDLPAFNPELRLNTINQSFTSYTDAQKICCDLSTCRCPDNLYMPTTKVSLFLEANDIRPIEDIYLASDNYVDCRSCMHYGRPQCVPFRNWIRYANTYGFFPPKIDLCYEFDEDAVYTSEQNVDINAIYTKIEENIYYLTKKP